MPTRVRSFSKINLGLAVGPARPDGFHGLATVYQTLEAHDIVTVSAHPAPATRITIAADHPGVPRTETGDAEKNTVHRILTEALAALGRPAEIHVDLRKRLPVQGGLGAGSANAAAALLGLENELQHLFGAARLDLGARVGSDIPLFFLGGTVLGTGRGEEVSPLPDLPSVPCVLAFPAVGVSTAQAFRDLDAQMAEKQLTYGPQPDTLKGLSHASATALALSGLKEHGPSGINWPGFLGQFVDLAENPLLALVRTGITNDFEEVAFAQHPSLRTIKRALEGDESRRDQALYAALSGSGSTLFGLYATQEDAREAQQRVERTGTRSVLTRTLPRADYWSTMFAE